jgi:porin
MRRLLPLLAPLLAALVAVPAQAQDVPATPEARGSVPGGQDDQTEGLRAPLWQRGNLLGDPLGLRSALRDRGVTFGLSEASEVFGNPSGGTRRGAVYEGLTQFGMGIDTQKLLGLPGGTFNVTGLQIHGRGLSFNNLGNNLHTVSSLEAQRGTLLFELWYEQRFWGDLLSVRAGQLSADQEFMISQYATLFLNHTFGWSTLPSTDLPSGGPSYPLGTPGVRVRLQPTEKLAVLGAVFNGDPSGPGGGTPQDRNPSGTAFRVRDGVLAILEVQLGIGDADKGLAGSYKLGGYYNSNGFADQRRNAEGLSLADPASSEPGRRHRGDFALYGVMDQLLWRDPTTKDGGLGLFARMMGTPGDRNLVNFYLDAGLTLKAPFRGRDSDTVGLGIGIARISDTASKLDSDNARYAGTATPIRRHETVLELSYQAQIAPWWQVQPDLQYVFNPGGGVTDPLRPGKRLGDAVVLGLRTNVTF